jgi:beta-phosphoglucomutase
MKPKAVIFDMDGVIVDSMPYHFLAWYEALRPFGIRLGCFEVYAREGERWEKTLKDLLANADIKPTKLVLGRIFRLRQKIFKKYFKRFIFKGAGQFLECLKNKGYLLGLVTGTPKQEVQRILPARIKRLFDCIVSGDSVHNGKPHPEPYLKAARLLGVKQSECVVVENAPLGIESGKKAGMFCIAVTTSLPAQYLKEADMVVDELAEITGVIEKTCRIK